MMAEDKETGGLPSFSTTADPASTRKEMGIAHDGLGA